MALLGFWQPQRDLMATETGLFHRLFERAARAVRTRLVLRQVLTWASGGALVGAAGAALLWWQRLGDLRPWSAVAIAAGALVGVVLASRNRWSDTDVALFLDARLGSREAISTAVELRSEAERSDQSREVVVRQAATALEDAGGKRARPRVLGRRHGLLPLGVAGIAYLSLAALPPPPPAPPPAPGVDLAQVDDVKGLEKIIALEQLTPRDAEQEKRLEELAERARKLREQLKNGMERREALSKIGKLRDDIAAERLKLGDQKNRPGLEAAVGKLSQSPLTKDAAEALGDGDLTRFDEEMKKLANAREDEDREAAKKALEDALDAAKQKGAEDVAKALEEQKKLFEERQKRSQALRELARSMGDGLSDEARENLEEFGESGSPEAQKKLADSLGKALEGLSEEERKQLAENMQKRMQGQAGESVDPLSKEQIEDLAKQLADPNAQKQLQDSLKELAKSPSSSEQQRQRGLDDAERGGADAQKQLGAPMPMPGPGQKPGQGKPGPGKEPGQGQPGQDGQGQGKGQGSGKGQGKNPAGSQGQANGHGGPGSHKDTGKGTHDGETGKIDGRGLRAKARGNLSPGGPLHGASRGRAPARAGETANQRGSGALGKVAPDEVSGVERSDVPQEYREQVGRYFQD